MKTKNLLLYLTLLLACSCAETEDSESTPTCIDNDAITEIGEFPAGFTADVIRMDAEEFGRTPGMNREFTYVDSTLFLSYPYPSGKIIAVDFSGRIRWIKEKGEDPTQDYRNLRKLIGDKVEKKLTVYDDHSRKRFEYDLDGNFLSYAAFPYYFSDVAHVDGGILVNIGGYLNESLGDTPENKLELIRLDGPEIEAEVLTSSPYYDKREVVFIDNLDITSDESETYYSRNYGDTLFRITEAGLEPVRVFCFAEDNIAREVRQKPDVTSVIQTYLDENIPYFDYIAPAAPHTYLSYAYDMSFYFALVKEDEVLLNSDIFKVGNTYLQGKLNYDQGVLLNQMYGSSFDALQDFMRDNPGASYSEVTKFMATVPESDLDDFVYTIILPE